MGSRRSNELRVQKVKSERRHTALKEESFGELDVFGAVLVLSSEAVIKKPFTVNFVVI